MLLVQISDTHLREDGGHPRHDPLQALRRAVRAINAMTPRPDAVLLTGDVLDRAGCDYGPALAVLAALRVPLLPLPGNHDRGPAFRAAFAGHVDFAAGHQSFAVDLAGQRVIGLDSCAADGSALIDAARRDWLAARLAEGEGPAVLALHHPPFATGIPRLDRDPFPGAEALGALIATAPRPCRLLAGHTHRAIATSWAGVAASTAPALGHALALSLVPGAPHAHVAEPPAFQLHAFRDGNWITHTLNLGHAAAAEGFAGPLAPEAAARLVDP